MRDAVAVYTGGVKVAEPLAVVTPTVTAAVAWYTTVAKMAEPEKIAAPTDTAAEAV